MPERRAAYFAASRASGSMPLTLQGIPGFIQALSSVIFSVSQIAQSNGTS
jgi:hypothetical protein